MKNTEAVHGKKSPEYVAARKDFLAAQTSSA
jgi:hypothetical protein